MCDGPYMGRKRMREGEYGKGRVPVVSHALDIPARLKELDERYFVMLNTDTQKYEIHCAGADEMTLECVLPFGELDERSIRYAREHRMERMEEILREMEAHNRSVEEKARKTWLREAGERTMEAVKYLKNRTDTDEIPKELMEK